MKTTTLIAIFLIALGVIALGYQGITYTTSEKVVDIGPLQVTENKTKTFPLPPIVGGLALVGGIVLLVVGRKTA
ncbi:MAG: DUF3185 domain-containing protein [Desulfobulbus sp.]